MPAIWRHRAQLICVTRIARGIATPSGHPYLFAICNNWISNKMSKPTKLLEPYKLGRSRCPIDSSWRP